MPLWVEGPARTMRGVPAWCLRLSPGARHTWRAGRVNSALIGYRSAEDSRNGEQPPVCGKRGQPPCARRGRPTPRARTVCRPFPAGAVVLVVMPASVHAFTLRHFASLPSIPARAEARGWRAGGVPLKL